MRVRLYSKAGCHLCDDAAAELARLARRYPHQVELVDVSAEPELMQRYGLRIPVVEIGGREYDAPLNAATLERALKDAHAGVSPCRAPRVPRGSAR